MGTRNRFGGRRRNGSNGSTLGTVVLLAFMLAVAVLPLMPSGARAADDTQIDANGLIDSTSYVDDQDLTVATPDAAGDGPVIGDPPVGDPLPTGTVQVNKFGCSDGYAGDYAQLAANCVAMDAPFTVYDGAGQFDFGGSFTADGVLAGSVSIVESVPYGYGDPIVYCNVNDAAGNPSGYFPAPTTGATLDYELEAGAWLACDWFNIADDSLIAEGGNWVVVNKWECPVAYDWDGKGYGDLLADCAQPQDGVAFSLTQGDAVVASGTTGDTDPGTVVFDGLFPGNYTIQEQVPAGYSTPVVVCGTYDATVALEAAAVLAELVNADRIDATMEQGQYVSCDWFNFPNADSSLTIQKWECPENLAFVAAPTVDDLLAACSAAQDGVTFDLTYPSDGSLAGQTRVTGDDGPGTAIFNDVQPGNVRVQETIPAGYGDPMVACGWGAVTFPAEGGVGLAIDGMIPLATVPGGTLDTEWIANEQMACNWFNFPKGGADIVVNKWSCPTGWNAGKATYDELAARCTDVMSGIDFTLSGLDGGLIGVESTDDSGTAVFQNVGGGAYNLAEAIPSGYGEPIVYCFFTEGEGDQFEIRDGSAIRLEFPGTYKIVCEWFNIPSDNGSITIYKYTCPEGYNLSLADDPKADCLELTNGITFELSEISLGYADATTGESMPGGVSWSDLPSSTYTVKEEIPAGIVGTYVFCQWYDAEGPYRAEYIQPYNAVGDAGLGDAIDLDLATGDRIVCLWFNAPDWNGGYLVVTKYWCTGTLYDAARCDLYGGGQDFEVEQTGGWGGAIPFTTGLDGTYTLNLAAGEYTLTEIGREWCRAESDQVNADGYVEVDNGETSYVNVYNCGKKPVPDETPKKFPNTGVGSYLASADRAQNDTTIAFAVASMLLLAGAGLSLRRVGLKAQPVRVRG